jgi:hypothetical protein
MVKRQTWVLVAVFVVLIGLAFFWTRYQNNYKQSHPTPSPTPQKYMFTIDSAAIASITITSNVDGKTVMVARDTNGQWSLVEPKADYTDVANVEAAATQLGSLQVISTMDTTDNLAEYGLDNPTYTLTVIENGGQQHIAQIGNSTATSNGYYVLIPGSLPQIVSKYSIDAVLKLWETPPIATATLAPTQTGTIVPVVTITATLPAATATDTPLPVATDTLVPVSTATQTPVSPTPTMQPTSTPVAVTPTNTVTP